MEYSTRIRSLFLSEIRICMVGTHHVYKAYSVFVISYVFGLIGNVTYLEALASQLDTNINNMEFFVHGKII